MSFWSNLLFAVIGSVHPALAFLASIVKWLWPSSGSREPINVIDIVRKTIPFAVGESLAADVAADIYESDRMRHSVARTVPFNPLILKCERCPRRTHYFVKRGEAVVCSHCLSDELSASADRGTRLLIVKTTARTLVEDLAAAHFSREGIGALVDSLYDRTTLKNCPACGRLIEVAKPNPKLQASDVKLVRADQNPFDAHKYGKFPCPECGVQIVAIY